MFGELRVVEAHRCDEAIGLCASVRIERALGGSHGTRGAQIIEGFLAELVGEFDAIGERFAGLRHLMDNGIEAAKYFFTAWRRTFEVDPGANPARIVRPLSLTDDLHT